MVRPQRYTLHPMKALMQAVMARVMGHINGRDCRHVPGDVFGRAPESGFYPASGRVVFITGLPTEALVFKAGAVCLRLRFRA